MFSSHHNGDAWEQRYLSDKISTNADEAEWSAIQYGQAHFSAGTMDEAITESGDEHAPEGAEFLLQADTIQGAEVLQESRQGPVYELLAERQKLLGESYPFRFEGNTLVYEPSEGPPIYELLVGICQSPSLTRDPYTRLPRFFEQLSLIAACGYFGPEAEGYRVGWPRPENQSRFQTVIRQLKVKSGNYNSEWQWQPAEHLPDNPAPKFIKDEGMDLVVWRKWADNRSGQLYLIGQCACGGDWLNKDRDLDLGSLEEWFRLPRVLPIRSFFTPRYVIDALLVELSRTAGLIFDRVRLVQVLSEQHIAEKVQAVGQQIVELVSIAKQPLPQ